MPAFPRRRVVMATRETVAFVTLTAACVVATGEAAHAQKAAPASAASAAANRVTLPSQKLAALDIATETIEVRTMQPMRTAPGRLRYDERLHVEVKTPAAGIVRRILVKPGDKVDAGDLIAVITSAEVGQVRADLLQLSAERDLARKQFERRREIKEGLSKLVYAIEQGADPRAAADGVAGVPLGEYRATLLPAYAAWRVADAMHRSGEASGASGALTGRQIEQRRGDFVTAHAALQSAIEQSTFAAETECLEAENRLADAERRVAISAQQVAALQGGLGGDEAGEAPTAELSELRLVAPIRGTVESQRYAVSERVTPGDGLFVVADTSQLWVEAEIREQEWGALALEPGQKISVTGPTVGNEPLTAIVHYVGREVSRTTNSASLVATIANPRGVLRPGQFVQVRVPVAEGREAIAAPESAIVEHDGQSFVFVEDSPGNFRRVDVRTGIAANGMVEVVDGLARGASVVAKGAFALKSELLLDRSEE